MLVPLYFFLKARALVLFLKWLLPGFGRTLLIRDALDAVKAAAADFVAARYFEK
jgi:hypothetical protein